MLYKHRMLNWALLAGVVAAVATGCGSTAPPSGTKTAAQIVPAMKTAAESATSVRMTGSGTSGSSTITFDLSFVGNSDISGTFAQGGTSLMIEVVAGTTYIKVNQGFLSIAGLPASDCTSICGKYVEVPAAEASQIAGSINLAALRKQVFGTIPASASTDTTTQFVPATYHGQSVLTAHGDGFTIDVASKGAPYPVLISAKGDNVTFSEWNSVPPLTPPPASEVITI